MAASHDELVLQELKNHTALLITQLSWIGILGACAVFLVIAEFYAFPDDKSTVMLVTMTVSTFTLMYALYLHHGNMVIRKEVAKVEQDLKQDLVASRRQPKSR